MLATVPGFTALSIGTAAKIGFKPQFVVSNVGSDPTTLAKTLGAAAPLLEGVVAANYLPLTTDDANPWIQLYKKVNSQYNGNAEFDNNIVYGMSVGYLFVQTPAGRRQGPDPGRPDRGGREGRVHRVPAWRRCAISSDDHSGYGG